MDIYSLFGMPLGYAKSSLERENMNYTVVMTESTSRFFHADSDSLYVVRVRQGENGTVELVANSRMEAGETVKKLLHKEEN